MLTELSLHHDVTYLALKDEKISLHPDEEKDPYAKEKIWLPWSEARKGSLGFFAELFGNLFSKFPYALQKYVSPSMTSWLAEAAKEDRYDLVVCDFLIPAANFRGIEFGAPTVLFQHNMEAVIWKRLSESAGNPVKRAYLGLQFRRFDRWERELSALFDGVVTVSPEDSAYAKSHYELNNVRGDVATGVDVDFFAPRKVIDENAIGTIGFLGSMDWMANIQAVEYFAEEIYPTIKSEMPDIRLRIIGRNPAPSVRALAERDLSIEVTGSVDDVRPLLKECDLMIVPLLAGGGTRIKILEAMAMGVPVVSTTIGAEGLGFENGKEIRIADGSAPFAAAVQEMLGSEELRRGVSERAFLRVRDENGWKGVTEQFIKLCAVPGHSAKVG